MATGTGKTFTSFQIIWRLWKAGARKRVLFLADRNILVDQTRTNDFKPFGSAMTKIQNRKADKAYEIYLALYQAITGTEEQQKIYKQFSKDFFDLIVVDECHRGSAVIRGVFSCHQSAAAPDRHRPLCFLPDLNKHDGYYSDSAQAAAPSSPAPD